MMTVELVLVPGSITNRQRIVIDPGSRIFESHINRIE
jgi:hypothetical protein